MNENMNEGATTYSNNYNVGATQAPPVTNQPPQGAYAPPQNQAIYTPPVFNNEEMTVGSWILTIFLLSIPVVNIILLIVWIVSSDVKFKQRSNYCKALLIYTVARWVLVGILGAIIFLIALLVFGDLDRLLWNIEYFFEDIFYSIF